MLMKKYIIYPLLSLLLICANALDGYDVKFNKFINYYFIDQQIDWGNLYLEGVDVDFKAAVLAQRKLNGGYFDEKVHAVIPHDSLQTNKEWKNVKDNIAHFIGPMPASSQTNIAWENSCKTIENLLEDAHRAAPIFKNDFQKIAEQTQSITYFGPGGIYLVKSKESLVSKVERDAKSEGISREEAVSKIGDTLRGSLIVDDLNKIPTVIGAIINYAHEKGAKVTFKNLWKEDRESGYVGIHAKILYPVPDSNGIISNHYVLAEMQIHLESMLEGGELSAKERAHLIYENTRSDDQLNSAELSAASKLLFLTAMEEALTKAS
jgi:ppGpp synthetase/RelA/SpoT-type nucleotidyltranferase